MGRKNNYFGRKGFTLIEAVSTVAVLAMVMLALLVVLKPQIQIMKAKDAQRKTDVKKISKALEDYLNDNPCYPDTSEFLSVLADCGGNSFRPYLSKIPCDPVTKLPYLYENPECQKFAVFTTLITENQAVVYLGTDREGYNYVVTSPNYRLTPDTIDAGGGIPDPTATPAGSTPTQRYYGCFSGICRILDDPPQCQPSYAVSNCSYDDYLCGTEENPDNECTIPAP